MSVLTFSCSKRSTTKPPPPPAKKLVRQPTAFFTMTKMDDAEYVCPLCCEELDISDREFYPCKCGYQVCMWCWHRIRESETGLCPACRTPYGEDPHQFSAVDVEEVLRQNKEKEAAAKRERQRLHENGEAMEVPKDRSQLANMRVIRRNLVYAVGLPPGIASEDNLRKPEYFGQYGRISKIVLNRQQANSGDPRRASASAYVTFVHKEDTLACILAMDGFYLENRNIRASYGTSKYCSAFIKNVRCNNPECTYLHEMGAAEDTFTKQEIQAGYVTSGRDVLARQQQIVAEQLRQLGSGGGPPRKRIGGGGPSGSGKAHPNPVFPAPEFDEPSKPAPTLVPPPQGVGRSVTTTATGVAPVSMSKASRSASAGTTSRSPTLAAAAAAGGGPAHRKTATAASVVAGMRTASTKETQDPHTTLTPLTPLKRSTKSAKPAPAASSSASVGSEDSSGLAPLRNGKKSGRVAQNASAGAPSIPTHASSQESGMASVSSIGGDVIGPPLKPRATPLGSLGGDPVGHGLDSLGGEPISMDSIGGRSTISGALGGEVYTGDLPSKSIGGSDKWNAGSIGGTALSMGPMLGGGGGSAGLWSGGDPASHSNSSVGGGIIGSQRNQSAAPGDSTSALASILGINLPTGSGSLQESSNLWSPAPAPQGPSALSSLNGSSMPTQGNMGGPASGGSSLIGGVPIGGGSSGTIGGSSNKSDIALLQSLLPGVHITSGSDVGANNQGWSGPSANQGYGPGSLNGDSLGGDWGGQMLVQGPSVGSINGQNNNMQQQNQRQGPGIW